MSFLRNTLTKYNSFDDWFNNKYYTREIPIYKTKKESNINNKYTYGQECGFEDTSIINRIEIKIEKIYLKDKYNSQDLTKDNFYIDKQDILDAFNANREYIEKLESCLVETTDLLNEFLDA